MLAAVNDLLRKAGLSKADVAGIGIGAPGPLSHTEGIIICAPNLPGWVNVPLRNRLAKATALPVVLENDANAAAYGEFLAGAGRGARSLVMLTLGTGIGGGVVLDGRLWRGEDDSAGEIGHTIIVPDGRPCPCGQAGCFERYASANAVAERLVESIRAGARSVLSADVWGGRQIDARDVLAAADAGDAPASRIWDETCFYLALGCINVEHLLSPERIVLAGGLIQAGDRLLRPLQQHIRTRRWSIATHPPQVALAALGADAGTIGAAALAREM
jgi:glucokinase